MSQALIQVGESFHNMVATYSCNSCTFDLVRSADTTIHAYH